MLILSTMNWFLKITNCLYRLWFYILVAISTILLFPFLFIFTIKETQYRTFYKVARIWGGIVVYGMGFYPKVKRLSKLEKGKSYILVANHSSMIDIMMMYCVVQTPFIFVGKKELTKVPVFGFFYKRSSIVVDRNDLRSRNAVFAQAQRRINQGNSICLFPEGGVPKNYELLLDKFKDGPFRMAIDHQIPVVPIIFYDNKKAFPYKFGKAHPGPLRVKIFPPISTEGMNAHKHKGELRESTKNLIYEELSNSNF